MDGGGVDRQGVHLSLWMHQEYTFRHRSACRTPVESGQEYLTSGKEYIEPCKTQQDKRTRGKTGELVGLDLRGELKQGSDPTLGQLSELEEKHLRLKVKQLI